MSENTRFLEINVESFLGINPQSPLAIVFPGEFNGVTVFSGDQETGKSSALKSIEALLGAVFPDYYLNTNTKDQKGWSVFIVDAVTYRSKLTKSSFKLEQKTMVVDKEKWIPTGNEKTLIRKLMPYATSPQVLTAMDGEAQIKWLKEIVGSNVDDSELKKKYDTSYSTRTAVNREVEIYKRQLIESGGYVIEAKDVIPTEEYQKTKNMVLGADIDNFIKQQEEAVKTLKATENIIIRAKAEYDGLDDKIDAKTKEVDDYLLELERINKKIEEAKNSKKELIARKEKGKEYLDANKDISDKVKEAEGKLIETNNIKQQKEQIKTTDKLYEDFKSKFDESIKLTTELDNINQERLALAKKLTPDIEGFEVSLGNIEKSKGLYLNGINVSTLSESERYGLCLKIWKFYKVKVVFIENLTDLGTKAMQIIQMFIDNGGIVFATMMDRSLPTRKISFTLNPEKQNV